MLKGTTLEHRIYLYYTRTTENCILLTAALRLESSFWATIAGRELVSANHRLALALSMGSSFSTRQAHQKTGVFEAPPLSMESGLLLHSPPRAGAGS
jgi:hypothetical protein